MFQEQLTNEIVYIYKDVDLLLVFNEMENLFEFFKNGTKSIYFSNKFNNNNRYELVELLESFINNKNIFTDGTDDYRKALYLYYKFEIIDSYYKTFEQFCDLFIEIKTHMDNKYE